MPLVFEKENVVFPSSSSSSSSPELFFLYVNSSAKKTFWEIKIEPNIHRNGKMTVNGKWFLSVSARFFACSFLAKLPKAKVSKMVSCILPNESKSNIEIC